jgi:sec-independent protein translocase protein TatA
LSRWTFCEAVKGGYVLFGLGTTELLIILAIVLFIYGGRKLPEISRGIGLSVRNFKKGLHEPDAIDITPKVEERAMPDKGSDSKAP